MTMSMTTAIIAMIIERSLTLLQAAAAQPTGYQQICNRVRAAVTTGDEGERPQWHFSPPLTPPVRFPP